ncbi:hypothetical protein D9615_006549 [Tricholomella constricta]|uniref:Uncharacterized protein n=1 Tax=Tricholomella constricta TaxID=117010 RepID=A0A8H5H9P7_9AGAR|nr:hypothetical protein D9615_006549 [Tricholomella constricta]
MSLHFKRSGSAVTVQKATEPAPAFHPKWRTANGFGDFVERLFDSRAIDWDVSADTVYTSFKWPSDHIIDKAVFPEIKPTLLDLMIAVNIVHLHREKYGLFFYQSYWYADVIARVLCQEYGGEEAASKKEVTVTHQGSEEAHDEAQQDEPEELGFIYKPLNASVLNFVKERDKFLEEIKQVEARVQQAAAERARLLDAFARTERSRAMTDQATAIADQATAELAAIQQKVAEINAEAEAEAAEAKAPAARTGGGRG